MENPGLIERTAEWLARTWIRGILVQPFRHRLIRFCLSYRTSKIKCSLKSCGRNVGIQLPVVFAQPEMIEVGNDVSFSAFVHIWGAGSVLIGDRVMIGSHSAITSITHDYTQDPMHTTVVTRPVIIEDDAWLSAHVLIMPGVTIGRGAVVGAGSVVTKNVPAGAIVAGVPAQVLKMREVIFSRANGVALEAQI
jgi:maltose O-acetyltransferase